MADRPTWDLPAVIKAAIDKRLLTVHTHVVARVLKYDPVRQRVDAQAEIRKSKYGEDGSRAAVQLPVFVDVPVAWPQFGGFRMVGPLNPGDRVLLEFSEQSLDRWKPNGGDVDPADDRRFHASDAVAIPGVTDAAHALKDAPTAHMSIGADDGSAAVSIDKVNSEVRVGDDSASKHAAFNEEFSAFVGLFASWTPVSGDGGAALKTLISNYLTAHTGFPVGAVKVKVK